MTLSRPHLFDDIESNWHVLEKDHDLVEVTVRLPRTIVEEAVVDGVRRKLIDQDSRIALVRTILAGRKRRGDHFGPVRFGEPSWDMMLELYIAAYEGRKFDASGLFASSGVPPTTAGRHIQELISADLVVRQGDPLDARRVHLVMAQRLRDILDRWIDVQIAMISQTFGGAVGAPAVCRGA